MKRFEVKYRSPRSTVDCVVILRLPQKRSLRHLQLLPQGKLSLVACEQALLFGRAKQAARERASVSSRVPLACLLFTTSEMESLLAGYTFGCHVTS